METRREEVRVGGEGRSWCLMIAMRRMLEVKIGEDAGGKGWGECWR